MALAELREREIASGDRRQRAPTRCSIPPAGQRQVGREQSFRADQMAENLRAARTGFVGETDRREVIVEGSDTIVTACVAPLAFFHAPPRGDRAFSRPLGHIVHAFLQGWRDGRARAGHRS